MCLTSCTSGLGLNDLVFVWFWPYTQRYGIEQVSKPSPKPLAVFKMADYRDTLVTFLAPRPGSVPTLAYVEKIWSGFFGKISL